MRLTKRQERLILLLTSSILNYALGYNVSSDKYDRKVSWNVVRYKCLIFISLSLAILNDEQGHEINKFRIP